MAKSITSVELVILLCFYSYCICDILAYKESVYSPIFSYESLSLSLSLSLIAAIAALTFPAAALSQQGATLYVAPASGSFFVESTFSVSIFVNTGGNAINAVEVGLTFPPDKLQVVSPTAGKSFISLWVSQPEFSNINGTLNLAGIEPSPGINTSSGLVTTVVFRIKSPGEATIQFTDASKVLKNDGVGTNILNSLVGGSYVFLIPPPEGPGVTSTTHPDRNTWHRDPNPVFSWTKDEGVKEFSYDFDRNPRTVPDNLPEGDHTVQEYTGITDGIWYFHVRARTATWGGTTHFPVLIDTTPPALFAPEVFPRGLTEAQRGTVSFVTTDSASGVDHYELKVENISDMSKRNVAVLFFEATSPYRLPFLDAGTYRITVRVHDRAGNFIDAPATFEVATATLLERIVLGDLRKWFLGGLLTIVVLVILMVTMRKSRGAGRASYNSKGAVNEIDKVFDTLEHDLLAKLEELEQAKGERELTKKEKELHDKIIKDLSISEDELKHYLGGRHSKKKKE